MSTLIGLTTTTPAILNEPSALQAATARQRIWVVGGMVLTLMRSTWRRLGGNSKLQNEPHQRP